MVQLVTGDGIGEGAYAAKAPVRRRTTVPGGGVQTTQQRDGCGPHCRVFGHDVAERALLEVGGRRVTAEFDLRPLVRLAAKNPGQATPRV